MVKSVLCPVVMDPQPHHNVLQRSLTVRTYPDGSHRLTVLGDRYKRYKRQYIPPPKKRSKESPMKACVRLLRKRGLVSPLKSLNGPPILTPEAQHKVFGKQTFPVSQKGE